MTWRKTYNTTSKEYGQYNPTNQMLLDLKKMLKETDYAKKYKKGDKLDENDIEDIAKSVVTAFSLSYRPMKRSKGILGQFAGNMTIGEQEDLAKEYVKKILSNVTFGDDNFNKFVASLDLKRGNKVPYTINDYPYYNSPNILQNAIFYILHPSIDAEIRDSLPDEQEILNTAIIGLKEQIETKKKELEELIQRTDLTKKEQEKQIEKLKNEIGQAEYERDEALKGVKIAKEGFNYVVGGIKDIKDNSKIQNTALGKLLESNRSDVLNNEAFTRAGDPSFKKNIRKIKEELKASPNNYDDKEINYIITKALSENERYLKTVAANPDMFERDMSNDTIQKENEQFQSKLRQQNLRYILPKFIERREKLVENTLNPNLLKGAFAI